MKKGPFRFEDGSVAVSVFELDLEVPSSKVRLFLTIDLVAFLAAGPVEADRVAGVFDFEAGLQAPKAISPPLRGDRQRRGAAEIEVSPVPEVGLDDPPATDQSAVRRAFTRRPPAASATALFVSGGCEGKGPSDALAAAALGSLLPAIVLIQPKASSIRLRMRWLKRSPRVASCGRRSPTSGHSHSAPGEASRSLSAAH